MATYLDSSVLFVAFPDITNSFSNATTATLSWVLNAYTITFAALLVPALRRFGFRRFGFRRFALRRFALRRANVPAYVK